jgi:hypothetical protein
MTMDHKYNNDVREQIGITHTSKITRNSGKNESPTFLRYDTDCKENDASNNVSIVACIFVAAVTFYLALA